VAFLALAIVPPLQAAAGLFVLPAEAGLVSLYLVGIGLIVATAAHSERLAPGRLVEALWTGLVLAALVSAGFVLYQWLGQSWAGVMIEPPVARGRPAANLGQPNLLASLLVWGLIGLGWSALTGRIGRLGSLLGAAFLLLAIVIAQSRAGWLEVALLGVVALLWRRPLGTGRHGLAIVGLGLWFAVLLMSLGALNGALMQDPPRSAVDQMSTGKRPQIWRLMLDASLQSPWFGYGWNQGIQAHLAVAERYPDLHVVVQHAHNLALDLIVWNGWPIGLLLMLGLGAWLGRMAWKARTGQDVLMLAALATFLLHSMLELPHCLFLFLGPAAALAGTLSARHPLSMRLQLSRWLVLPLAAAASLALVTVFIDYRSIESDLMAYRVRKARIGDLREPAALEPHLLVSLQGALLALRGVPRRDMPAAEFDALQRAAQRYPSDGALVALAQASALNGRPEQSALALRRLCLLYPPPVCHAAQDFLESVATGADRPH
jgi:O-antigen ligase